MKPFPAADLHCLRAAEGWLHFGNEQAAHAELDHITPEFRQRPDVLTVRWRLYQRAGMWGRCFEVGLALAQSAPEDPESWLALAESLCAQGQEEDAYRLAISKLKAFPAHWPLYYHAACYACRTERLQQAQDLLEAAMILGQPDRVREKALTDPHLRLLWPEGSMARETPCASSDRAPIPGR